MKNKEKLLKIKISDDEKLNEEKFNQEKIIDSNSNNIIKKIKTKDKEIDGIFLTERKIKGKNSSY